MLTRHRGTTSLSQQQINLLKNNRDPLLWAYHPWDVWSTLKHEVQSSMYSATLWVHGVHSQIRLCFFQQNELLNKKCSEKHLEIKNSAFVNARQDACTAVVHDGASQSRRLPPAPHTTQMLSCRCSKSHTSALYAFKDEMWRTRPFASWRRGHTKDWWAC